MTFSEMIKQIRTIKNLTQEQLADELNIAFATVNRWEQGITIPQGANKEKLKHYCENNGINFDVENEQYGKTYKKIITASQLKDWFSQQKDLSRGLFPELIARLIKESCSDIEYIRFPSGDDINTDGNDGELILNYKINQFIPCGHSIWELGATTIASSKKINTDFYKRTKKISPSEQENTTFVLITPNTLKDRNKQTKRTNLKKEGHWKDVILLDGIDIEEWLSRCFSTSLWLYEKFNNVKINAYSIKSAINNIESETSPKASLTLYTAYRDNEIKQLKELLNTKQTIKIAGTSFFESYRFVISALAQDESISDSIVVCNNYESFISLDNCIENTILIANFAIQGTLQLKPQNTHILILGNNTMDIKYDMFLFQRPQTILYEILKNDMKLKDSQIQAIQHRAKNNVMLIIREIASENFLYTNEWLSDKAIKDLIPITILGQVNLKDITETKVLEEFLPKNTTIEDYITELKANWENKDNSPIFIYNEQIKVILKEEVWYECGKFVLPNINKIFDILNVIFSDHNPKYDLPIDKQAFSGLYLKQWNYSHNLIEGLFDSIILLAIYNGKQVEVDNFIKQLLSSIDTKEKLLSISPFFCLIAEASPKSFSEYVSTCLKSNDNILNHLFISRTNTNVLLGGHEYCELLWALEKLTFIDDTKFIACKCLFLLGNYDYQYNISNTPKDSLITTLHILRKNALTFQDKQEVMNELIIKYKEKAFYLPIETISKTMISYSTSSLKWRNAVIIDEMPNLKEMYDAYKILIENVLQNLPYKNIKLIEKIIDVQIYMNYQSLNDVKNYITQNYIIEDEEKLELYEYLQKKLYFILRYSKVDTPDDLITKIEELIKIVQPKDILKRNLIYFKDFNYEGCPNKKVMDNSYEKERNKALEFRKKLLTKLSKKYSIKLILDSILKIVPNDMYSGTLFYDVTLDLNDEDLITQIAILNQKYDFIVGYLNRLDVDKVDKIIDNMDYRTAETLAEKFSYNKYIPKRFLTDELLLKTVYKNRRILDKDNENEVNLVKKYNPVGYLCWLCERGNRIDVTNVNEICDILLSLDAEVLKPSFNIGYYEIQNILKSIDNEFYNEKVVTVCFKYLSYFEYNEIPNSIKTYFYLNPKDYISLIANKDGNASFIYHLESFITLPKDFKSNKEAFETYIETFMQFHCEDHNIIDIVHSSLGQILARSFTAKDDELLSLDFKTIIEKYSDEALNRGIIIGYLNARGVRTVSDGSDEMKKYQILHEQSKANQIRFPESAKILEELANDYYRNAKMDKETRLKIEGLL